MNEQVHALVTEAHRTTAFRIGRDATRGVHNLLIETCAQLVAESEARAVAEAKSEVNKERMRLEELFHEACLDLPDEGLDCHALTETFASRYRDVIQKQVDKLVSENNVLRAHIVMLRKACEKALDSFMATGSTPDGKWTLDFNKFRAAEHDYVRPALEATKPPSVSVTI